MSRWFRLYDELLDNPKVQRLPGEDFKAWINILCLASREEGKLPCEADIAFALRLDTKKAAAIIGRLVSGGLLERVEGGFAPHKWNDRQYKSDVSTGRVKRFRERSKKQDETATETAPDTDTDTDTDSVTNVTAPEPISPDPEKLMFDHGKRLLAESGVPNARAGPMLGKWKRDHGAEAVLVALGKAQREGAIDPISFIEGCLKNAHRNGSQPSRGKVDGFSSALREIAGRQAEEPSPLRLERISRN